MSPLAKFGKPVTAPCGCGAERAIARTRAEERRIFLYQDAALPQSLMDGVSH